MTSSPAPFAFGEVVLVPFPFTSHAATKRRPAVVVSASGYVLARPDVILMPITSQMRPSPAFAEVWLEDWRSAGLLKPSAVKPVLGTFEQRLIIRKLGTFSAQDAQSLRRSITQMIEMAA